MSTEKRPLFRKKALERVESPEKLNLCLRMTTPSIWIFLAALALFVAGIFLWAVFGRIDVTNPDGSITPTAPITFVIHATD